MTTQTDAKPANKMVFKVIDFEGDIRAQTVFAEDAASMVAFRFYHAPRSREA